ncbi:hypothetical protein BaRGS_00020777, partial [Batillaria attramentaria]
FEGLTAFAKSIKNLPNFSVLNLRNLLQVFYEAKTSAVVDLLALVKGVSKDELVDIVDMMFQIPGYASELMHSLPQPTTLDAIQLVGRLMCAEGGAPDLMADMVRLMAESPNARTILLQVTTEFLWLLQSTEGVNGDGAMQLLEMLHQSDITVEGFREFMTLVQKPELTDEAIRNLILAARSEVPICAVLIDLLRSLLTCNIKPDELRRLLNLLEKSKHVTPDSLGKLLHALRSSGVLCRDSFVEVSAVAGACQFDQPHHVRELVDAIKSQDFVTLEELSECLQKIQLVTLQDLEDQMQQQLEELVKTIEALDKKQNQIVQTIENLQVPVQGITGTKTMVTLSRETVSGSFQLGNCELTQEIADLKTAILRLNSESKTCTNQIQEVLSTLELLKSTKVDKKDLDALQQSLQSAKSPTHSPAPTG